MPLRLLCALLLAGPYHTAAITLNGELFTWGNGLFGQLGHGESIAAYTPRRVAALEVRDQAASRRSKAAGKESLQMRACPRKSELGVASVHGRGSTEAGVGAARLRTERQGQAS